MNNLSSLLVLAAVAIPACIAVALVWLQRKGLNRDGRRSPIENRTIFGAGEQLRKRVEQHENSAESRMPASKLSSTPHRSLIA
jgi:hypothetical protein